ncbi:helix-turn-helix domain-containing protein [Bacteroides thetaiotaomicron]|nr:helix-turn-helix domain-containing protein [Bacteroides thetaiotaomicron]MDC2170182.1 helix-turn-helix domain-containing protein [Bacteroides thetaiotaomicron]
MRGRLDARRTLKSLVADLREKINNCLLKDEQRNAEQIRMAVTISKGNLTQAAALLGISRPTLYKKMGMYGITKEQV